jgi:hypothetical protein
VRQRPAFAADPEAGVLADGAFTCRDEGVALLRMRRERALVRARLT